MSADKIISQTHNKNDIIINWEKLIPDDHKNINFTLQIYNKFKEWQTIYCGFKHSYCIKYLIPNFQHKIRLKMADSSDWLEFKAGTQCAIYTVSDLSKAIKTGNTTMIRRIIHERNDLLEIENKFNRTPLIQTIEKGDLQLVLTLIILGADINQSLSFTLKTPLMIAIDYKQLSIINLLLDKGANYNLVDINGMTALHHSIDSNNLEIVKIIIGRNTKIDQQDNQGWTPLMRAIILECNQEIIDLLLENNANMNITDKNNLNFTAHKNIKSKKAVGNSVMSSVKQMKTSKLVVNNGIFELIYKVCRTTNMRRARPMDFTKIKDNIFHELINECQYSMPGARLSYSLRNRLEKFAVHVRKEIVDRLDLGCSPLFISCKKGQTEIVEYLLTVCNADIELRGIYEVPDDRSTHHVTPLWCAAVAGRLSTLEILLKHHADINAVSDTGSTPVRSACFMTHYEIVRYLVENHADINKPNYNGGTCLINSVQSALLCQFLLENGALVNARDIQNKTALHYAIQEHRLETTKLLLKNGADCNAKSRYGDDPLQMACLKGASRIFDYLITHIEFTPEKLANAHELIGATFLDEHNEVAIALYHWKEALNIRQKYGLLPKQPTQKPIEGYRYQKEFENDLEYMEMSTDLDLIRIQSLLIAERILGPYHKDTIFRLMFRGAAYADMLRYQRCIDLWRRALEIRVEKDSILYTDTCFTAQALIKQMVDYHHKVKPQNDEDAQQRFHDVLAMFKMITTDLMDIRELLMIRPVYKRQIDFFDKILKSITHLIYLMIELGEYNRQIPMVVRLLNELIKLNPTSVISGDTLLHLCLTKSNTVRSSYFIDEEAIMVFPKCNIVNLLLDCGANINYRNHSGCTPLHTAINNDDTSSWLVKLLLERGAHIDQPNKAGYTPAKLLNELDRFNDIHVLDYISLKCLCSFVITKYRINYINQIPKTLENFVKLHET